MTTEAQQRALTLRPNLSDGDFLVMQDGRTAGRLHRIDKGPFKGSWFWSVYGQHDEKHGQVYHGVEPTLDAAQAKFQEAAETLSP